MSAGGATVEARKPNDEAPGASPDATGRQNGAILHSSNIPARDSADVTERLPEAYQHWSASDALSFCLFVDKAENTLLRGPALLG